MASRKYVRVKDKDTGHKYSVVEGAFQEDAMQELKQPATDRHGLPLAAEFAAPKPPSNQSGQKATTATKES